MLKAIILKPYFSQKANIPLFSSTGSCGFPSPADDYIEDNIDLKDLLLPNPTTTFLVRASGESMKNAGIMDGDLLVVDRSLTPKQGNVVVAVLNGETLVKRFYRKGSRVWLCSENKAFPPVEVKPDAEMTIWGVVTNAIHRMV